MNNQTILFILFLILTLILILISINMYYMSEINKLIADDNDNSNSKKTPEIIVSLTTSPKRIHKIKPLIDIIMNQTLPPDKMVLNLPYVFKRDNSFFSEIPDFITNHPKIIVNRCEDIGPITKIIPTIQLYSNKPETIVISIDDDTEYCSNFIEVYLQYSQLHPNSVVVSATQLMVDLKYFIEGFKGVLYKVKFFKNFDYSSLGKENQPLECYLADDFVISNYLAKENIPVFHIYDDSVVTQLDYGFQEDALHNGADNIAVSNVDNYEKCSSYLLQNNQLYLNANYLWQ